jgi:hypothetical protein
MRTSSYWKALFGARAKRPDLPGWERSDRLTPTERHLIGASLQQFQLGEGSDGGGLRRRAMKSVLAESDPDFVESVELFIREEQRHSHDLRRFLDREGIGRLEQHWVDGVFRRVRKLAGLELCLRTLVTAEIIAVPYYTALRGATRSPLLRAICEQILADEGDHLCYQAFQLMRLRASRRPCWPACEAVLWRLFLWGALAVVWREHGRVLAAGGYSWTRFRRECESQLAAADSPRLRGFKLTPETGELIA